MSEQPLEHSNIDGSVDKNKPLSAFERAQLEALKAREQKSEKIANQSVPDSGGSRVDSGLTHEQMLKTLEVNPVDPRILNPEKAALGRESEDWKVKINKFLSGDADLTADNAKEITNFAIGDDEEKKN